MLIIRSSTVVQVCEGSLINMFNKLAQRYSMICTVCSVVHDRRMIKYDRYVVCAR